jgi:branched-subunit amino acid transport protein
MTVLGGLEALVGGLLVFFVPGFFVTRALFPEWELRGRAALTRLVETLTLSFVLSVALTVLVGYALLTVAPGGFQAYWSDPVLEAALAGVAVVACGVAVSRNAFGRGSPTRPHPEPKRGDAGAWELTRELDRLGREERRLRRALETTGGSAEERELREHLEKVRSETDELRRRREAEYAE